MRALCLLSHVLPLQRNTPSLVREALCPLAFVTTRIFLSKYNMFSSPNTFLRLPKSSFSSQLARHDLGTPHSRIGIILFPSALSLDSLLEGRGCQ